LNYLNSGLVHNTVVAGTAVFGLAAGIVVEAELAVDIVAASELTVGIAAEAESAVADCQHSHHNFRKTKNLPLLVFHSYYKTYKFLPSLIEFV
jgi:hypothetical protein